MNHYRKTFHKYKSRQGSKSCPFCGQDTISSAIFENDLIYIAPNLTQYDLWELHDVENHLLIIPKRHVETLSELSSAERLAIMDQAAKYEAMGYSVYARGFGFVKRSVKHQHTHLLKVTDKKPRFAIFIRSPYYLFKK